MSEAKTANDLRNALVALTKARNDAIARINAEFDRQAVELNRQIEEIEPPFHCHTCGGTYQHRDNCSTLRKEAPIPIRRTRRRRRPVQVTVEGMDDWSAEDIAHYNQLRTRRA